MGASGDGWSRAGEVLQEHPGKVRRAGRRARYYGIQNEGSVAAEGASGEVYICRIPKRTRRDVYDCLVT